ncbi:uncharacterized protein BJ212DRAFT_1447002 [Suillus subaureus]|uniref:Uncharacterized protein n=1 Tax=Suillus subaureus TaxID=48587 RepID=A0A9P7JDF1_9AGAM|nr:uncharacterized protein BJ212DRAFT_1447002 [Suillus subaureus]KAG1815925.1 hypothetical protein BJ212DRAFT_1447002 [Suillus subaureus]
MSSMVSSSMVSSPPSSSIALGNMPSNSPPTLEEDLSHAHLWSQDNDQRDSQDISPPRSSTSTEKGKEKQLDEDTIENPSSESYPPTNDDAAETRRVEENLRRWELADRERRRAARESTQANRGAGGPSLLGEVTRRASVLLSKRPSVRSSTGGLGDHRALQSRDSIDVVPLDDIDQSPPTTANPFIHPSEMEPGFVSPESTPFVDTRKRSRVMTETFDSDSRMHSSRAATLPPMSTLVSPPQPLGLPPPLTPPPKGTRPRMAPMNPTPPPMLRQEPIEPEQEVRWWHDWLCGCSEGPDRGGDNQAGRTNPFE